VTLDSLLFVCVDVLVVLTIAIGRRRQAVQGIVIVIHLICLKIAKDSNAPFLCAGDAAEAVLANTG
jgi:hypothetical protein